MTIFTREAAKAAVVGAAPTETYSGATDLIIDAALARAHRVSGDLPRRKA